MPVISFKPKQVTKRLLSPLPPRGQEVIIKRFGLLSPERMTLESIGKEYGITRERVRQIENFSLKTIRKSDAYEKEQDAFKNLKDVVFSLGGIVTEEGLLSHIAKDPLTQNHIHLLLTVGDDFKKEREDEHFHHRWSVDEEVAQQIHDSLKKLYKNISDKDLVPESEMIAGFLDHLKDVSEQYKNEEVIKRWLSLSKKIDKNPLGEWGAAHSPNVHARGMRDYAYLIIRRHGSPMHFTEVAKAIHEVFGKKAHVATCHNELIKDKRFVLVGRGLYALSDWGYENGVVRDVIRAILKKEGPLTKDEIIERVLKERYVKENTVMVNLQNSKYFKKDTFGKYALA